MENNISSNPSSTAITSEYVNIVNNVLSCLKTKNNKRVAILPLSCDVKSMKAITDIAAAIASFGSKILLVDTFLDENKSFECVCSDGFTEFVLKNIPLDQCLSKSDERQYDVMPSGNIENGIKVLHSENIDMKLEELEQSYDIVLFSVQSLSSSVVKASMANLIGATIIIVDKDEDSSRSLILARDTIKDIIGLVVLKSKKKTLANFLDDLKNKLSKKENKG